MRVQTLLRSSPSRAELRRGEPTLPCYSNHVLSVLASIVLAGSEVPDRPQLIGSVRLSTFTGLPDVLGLSGTVHAIPFVDLEGGASSFVFATSWYVRGGPRWLFEDWRDESNRGTTLRLSALFGYKAIALPTERFGSFHFAGAIELTYWLAAHAGLTFQLSGGGTVRAWPRFFPELRLAWGVAF